MPSPQSERLSALNARLDQLQRTIESARRRWFCYGVACGVIGVYIGEMVM